MTTYNTTQEMSDLTAAFNYACGYNDYRSDGLPWVDGYAFAAYWGELCKQGGSRPSIQDAFRAFVAPVTS